MTMQNLIDRNNIESAETVQPEHCIKGLGGHIERHFIDLFFQA
jgi:hypothetical protein